MLALSSIPVRIDRRLTADFQGPVAYPFNSLAGACGAQVADVYASAQIQQDRRIECPDQTHFRLSWVSCGIGGHCLTNRARGILLAPSRTQSSRQSEAGTSANSALGIYHKARRQVLDTYP